MKGILTLLALAPLLGSCWLDNLSHDRTRANKMPPAPRTDRRTEDLPPTPDLSLTALTDPADAPARDLTEFASGGLRLVARGSSAPLEAGGSAASFRMTIRNRGEDTYGVHQLAMDTLSRSPLTSAEGRSLRQAVEALGGLVEIEGDRSTTSLYLEVPGDAWFTTLRRCAEMLSDLGIEADPFVAAQTDSVQRRIDSLGRDPARRLVENVLDGRELSARESVDTLLDISLDQVRACHGESFDCDGAVMSFAVPGVDTSVVLEQARETLRPWTGSGETPEQAPLPPVTIDPGLRWATSADPSSFILVLERPDAYGRESAAALIALESLAGSGAGGELGAEGLGFSSTILDRNGRSYLMLRAQVGPEQVSSVVDVIRRSFAELALDLPSAGELSTAANRARLQLLIEQAAPRAWHRASTRAALLALPVEAGESELLDETLAALERPTTLELQRMFNLFGRIEPIWVVYGGAPPEDLALDPLLLPDPSPAGLESAVDRRDLATQLAVARIALDRAVDAVGGRTQLESLRGLDSESATRSPDGLESADSARVDLSGTYRMERTLFGARIVTEVEEGAGRETFGEESAPLSVEECDLLIRRALAHPTLILARWCQQDEDWRLIGSRQVLDRELRVLERIGPVTQRTRIHVDARTGLIRTVEVLLPGVGTLRTVWRDYRDVDQLRLPFQALVEQGDGTVTRTTYADYTLTR